MPWGLKRFQQTRQLHFITCSCFHRQPNFTTQHAPITFELALERVRQRFGLCVYGYVVMPEHVHLQVSEPEHSDLAHAMQSLKQEVARTLALRASESFWQARYYDFNVWSERKFVEKLRYIHRNPVERGLVRNPEDWQSSSFRHYLTGQRGVVEIESQWTARLRDRAGIFPRVKLRAEKNLPPAELGRATPKCDCKDMSLAGNGNGCPIQALLGWGCSIATWIPSAWATGLSWTALRLVALS